MRDVFGTHMDAKTLAGKTVFFLLMVVSIAAFAAVFGQENSLVGVIIVVMVLMLLQKDMSVRPLANFGGILALNLSMGVCAYVSLLDAYLGIVINIFLVFAIVFLTMQDLTSPMHFPFLLGYAFMLATPVSLEHLPIRLLALFMGSVFIVVMNVIVNRNRFKMTSHKGMESLCRTVAGFAREAAEGGSPDPSTMDGIVRTLNTAFNDRMKSNFFTTPRDRSLLDLMVAVRSLGRKVCSRKIDGETLAGIADLMDALADHEAGKLSLDEFLARMAGFRAAHPDADYSVSTSLRAVEDALVRLSDSKNEYPGSAAPRLAIGVRLKEDMRTDSVKFTFAVRMSLMIAIWSFVWTHWGLENARWLLFTTAAIVQPYIEGSLRKSGMRLTGTLVGAVLFVILSLFIGADAALMSVSLMLINYVYTVIDPKRYDIQMAFVTVSALITAAIAVPMTDEVNLTVLAERVVYIFAGVFAATLANLIILPYRLRDESLDLASRHLALARDHFACLRDALVGRADPNRETYCVLRSANVSRKLLMNEEKDPSPESSALNESLDDLSARMAMLYRDVPGVGERAREAACRIIDEGCPEGSVNEETWKGMSASDADFVKGVAGAVDAYRESRSRLADMAIAGRA